MPLSAGGPGGGGGEGGLEHRYDDEFIRHELGERYAQRRDRAHGSCLCVCARCVLQIDRGKAYDACWYDGVYRGRASTVPLRGRQSITGFGH